MKKTLSIVMLICILVGTFSSCAQGVSVRKGEANGFGMSISNDGYWIINGVKTEINAQNGTSTPASITYTANGAEGNVPYIGTNGNWFVDGEDTGVKARGDDGITPHIGENGNWWIGETDTGVKATNVLVVDYGSIEFVDEVTLFETTEYFKPVGQIKYNLVDPETGAVARECNYTLSESDVTTALEGDIMAGVRTVSVKLFGVTANAKVKVNTYRLRDNVYYVNRPVEYKLIKRTFDGVVSEIVPTADMIKSTTYVAGKLGDFTVTIEAEEGVIGVCNATSIYYEDFNRADTQLSEMGALFADLGYKLPVPTDFTNAVYPGTGITADSSVLMSGMATTPNLLRATIVNGRLYCINTNGDTGISSFQTNFQILPEGAIDAYATVSSETGKKEYTYTVQYDLELQASDKGNTTDGIFVKLHGAVNTSAGLRVRHYAIINKSYGICHEYVDASGAYKTVHPNGAFIKNETIVSTLFPNGQPTENNPYTSSRMWSNVTVRLVVTPNGYDLYMRSEQVPEFKLISATSWTDTTPGNLTTYQDIMDDANAIVIGRTGNSTCYFDNIAVWGGNGEMPENNDMFMDGIYLMNDSKFAADIIVSENASNAVGYAKDKLTNGIKGIMGYEFGYANTNGGYEILIGNTGRAESNELLAELRDDEYAIKTIGKKIVIAAKDDAFLYEAVEEFLSRLTEANVEKNDETLILKAELDVEKKGDTTTNYYKIIKSAALGATSETEILFTNTQYDANNKTTVPYRTQGGCFDGTYYYQALIAGDETYGRMLRYNVNTGELIYSEIGNFGHMNDVTFNAKTNELIVTNETYSVHIFDPDTLEYKGVRNTSGPTTHRIAYDPTRDKYVTHAYYILDSNFNLEERFIMNNDIEQDGIQAHVHQSIATDDTFIYSLVPDWPMTGEKYVTRIAVYDWSGNYITRITVNVDGLKEPENISIVDGEIYITIWNNPTDTHLIELVKVNIQ